MGWKLFRVLRWTTDSTKPALNKLGAMLMAGDTKRLWLSLSSGWFAVDTPPVGATYMQFPGKSDPGTLWPNSTWSNISSEALLKGRVPRIEGAATYGSAASFGSSQDDQGQGHRMGPYPGSTGIYHTASGSQQYAVAGGTFSFQPGQPSTGDPVTDGTNGTPRMGTETRAASVTVRIWQRTA